MKSFLRLSLAAIAVTLFFNAFTVTEAKAQQLTEIVKRMDTHNKSLTSLQSSVRMEKYNVQIKETDVFEGTVKYLPQKGKDAYVRIDWLKPRTESLAVGNKQYILYTPSIKQAIIGNINDAKAGGKGANNALAFLNMSKSQLSANYSPKYIGQETVAGITTWHLELTPKTAQSYKTADLWVDANGMPIQAKVTENNGDTTTIYLSNIEKNKTLNASVFAISPPKGTKIVKG